MTILDMLLWFLGGLAVIALICVGTLWLEKNFPGEQYDERQKIARGSAYRVGFFVGLIWLFLGVLIWKELGDWLMLYFFLGFEAQALAFHFYCLLTHAALPMSEKPWTAIISYGAIAAVDAVNVITSSRMDARWPEKPPVNTWMQLSMAVGFGALAILHLIQHLRDRKE